MYGRYTMIHRGESISSRQWNKLFCGMHIETMDRIRGSDCRRYIIHNGRGRLIWPPAKLFMRSRGLEDRFTFPSWPMSGIGVGEMFKGIWRERRDSKSTHKNRIQSHMVEHTQKVWKDNVDNATW